MARDGPSTVERGYRARDKYRNTRPVINLRRIRATGRWKRRGSQRCADDLTQLTSCLLRCHSSCNCRRENVVITVVAVIVVIAVVVDVVDEGRPSSRKLSTATTQRERDRERERERERPLEWHRVSSGTSQHRRRQRPTVFARSQRQARSVCLPLRTGALDARIENISRARALVLAARRSIMALTTALGRDQVGTTLRGRDGCCPAARRNIKRGKEERPLSRAPKALTESDNYGRKLRPASNCAKASRRKFRGASVPSICRCARSCCGAEPRNRIPRDDFAREINTSRRIASITSRPRHRNGGSR